MTSDPKLQPMLKDDIFFSTRNIKFMKGKVVFSREYQNSAQNCFEPNLSSERDSKRPQICSKPVSKLHSRKNLIRYIFSDSSGWPIRQRRFPFLTAPRII